MWRISTIVVILLSTTLLNGWGSISEVELSRESLKDFPKAIGDWQMISDQLIEKRAMSALLVDDYIMRTYENRTGDVVHLYIGYFRSQREGKQIHSPRQCLPGSGWNIIKHEPYNLAIEEQRSDKAYINLEIVGQGADKNLFLWWYQSRGRMYADEYLNKLYLIWDSLTKGRTDGSLVRVHSRVKDDEEKTLKTEAEFIKLLVPYLSQYIPD